jgi:hypothetical protein
MLHGVVERLIALLFRLTLYKRVVERLTALLLRLISLQRVFLYIVLAG